MTLLHRTHETTLNNVQNVCVCEQKIVSRSDVTTPLKKRDKKEKYLSSSSQMDNETVESSFDC